MIASFALPAVMPLAGQFGSFTSTDTWVFIAFVLFILLLVYVGVPKLITDALDARAAKIRDQLNEARELREQAQTKLAEIERRQAEVKTLAAEIVETAQKDAAKAAENAKASIASSVEKRIKSAEEQIALAEADAVRRVRNEAVDAAVAATADVLKKSGGDAAGLDKAIQEVSARLN
ncbi:MAG: ATP F0F1 synthase subunit B [Pseudomonadota bacterium]